MKNIIEKIPTSWKEIKVKDYQKLSDVIITESSELENLFVGLENTVKVLSVFTGLTVDELESLSMKEITEMSNRLNFMMQMPEINKKSKIKWKKVDEITYGDFILFQQFSSDFFHNLHLLIPAFSKEKITEDEILEMNLEDMNTAFFFLRKNAEKSLRRTAFYLQAEMINRKIAMKITNLVYKLKWKKKKQ